jgi:hypothetical protein
MPFITTPGLPLVPLRFGQITLGTSNAKKFSDFTMATFTGSAGTDTTQLVVTSVTGTILVNDVVAGTGITAGTKIVSQVSGTVGGAGTYQLSATNTANSNSLTSGGVPPGATLAFLTAETANIRWRDDGVAPTSSVGMLFGSSTDMLYGGTLANIQFIGATGSPVLDVAFYKSP